MDIYQRHFSMVYQICLLQMKNVPDAEDAAQTVFGYAFSEGTNLEWESYTAPSGLEAQIMRVDRTADYRDTCLAAFSLNGIPTVVRTHSSNSYAEARDALIQILDGFLF